MSADGLSLKIERAFAASGFVLMAVFLVGFWPIAGFLPPPAPSEGAQQIAAFFARDTTAIHLGLWMTMLAAALVVPWAVAISHQLKRIEGGRAPLADAQLVLGALLVLEFIIPLMLWQAAAFRPLESPEITQRFNDLAWLMFVGVVSTGVLEAVVIGAAILLDRARTPMFPRWLGYFNLFIALLFLPAGLCVFFKHGPLGWNGLISWWMLLAAFGAWILTMSVMLLAANTRQQQAEEHAPAHQQQPDGVRPELAAPAAPPHGAPRFVES